MELTDAELDLRQSLEGDGTAERALYDRHVDRVFQTAFRLSGDMDVAADYTQEAFIKAFARLQQFRGDAAFSTWLRSIVASVALRGERQRARTRGTVDMDAIPDRASAGVTVAFDVRDVITATLDQMSEKLRSVFLLYDVEGYTHEEIGDCPGHSPRDVQGSTLCGTRSSSRGARRLPKGQSLISATDPTGPEDRDGRGARVPTTRDSAPP